MRSLHYIELKILVEEFFNKFKDFYVDKFFRHNDKYVLLIRRRGEKVYLCIYPGKSIYLIKKFEKSKDKFSSEVESRIKRRKVLGFNVLKGERVILVNLSNGYKILVELFNPGNIILVDENNKIIDALIKKNFGFRKIYPGEEYKLPPKSNVDPFEINFDEFLQLLKNSKRKDLIRFLILDLNLGKCYADEIIFRSKLDPNKRLSEISIDEAKILFSKIEEVKSERVYCLYNNEFSFVKLNHLGAPKKTFDNPFDLLIEVYEYKEEKVDKTREILLEKLSEMEKLVKVINENKGLLKFIYEELRKNRNIEEVKREVKTFFGKEINIVRIDKTKYKVTLI